MNERDKWNLQLEKNKVIDEYERRKRERTKILFHNLGESFKPVMIYLIGILLAGIFFFAGFGIIVLFGKSNPLFAIFSFITIIFIYGCTFYDLIQPYLKSNYIQNEK